MTVLILNTLLLFHSLLSGSPSPISDTTGIALLLDRAIQLESQSPHTSIQLTRDALSMAIETKYGKGLTKSYNHLGWLYNAGSQFDSSILYYNAAYQVADSLGFLKEKAIATQGIGEGYMRLFISDSARHYLHAALQFAGQIGDKNFEAGILNNLANISLNENRYEEALNTFIRSAHLYDSMGNNGGLAKALSNIGNIEYRLNHLEKAIDYANKSKTLASVSNHTSGVGYAHKLLGWIYRKQGALDKSLLHYDSALAVYKKLNSKRDIAEVSLSMGNAYYDLHDYKKAISYYQQTLRSSFDSDYKPFNPYAYSGLAYTYYTLGNYKVGLLYADSLATTARAINAYLLLDALDLKSLMYEKQDNHKLALAFSREHQVLKDSLSEKENRKAMEEAEAKFQNDLKQNEIDQLKLAHNLRESRLQTIQISVALTLVFIVVIAILVINRFRTINKANRQIEIERMRNVIARDLHDDIGSALSSINIVSQLATKDPQPASMLKNFQRINDQSARVMESMSDIVWSINPENDTIQRVEVKMREFAAEILEPKNIQIQFEKTDIPLLVLNSEQRKNIFLVFKEAINNVAKYSDCNLVIIELTIVNKELTLKIQDNGKGFDLNTIKTGNGVKNMMARAHALNGKLEVESAEGGGTTIFLKMNLT